MRDLLIKGKSFLLKSKRVWHALKKPTKEEFIQITKISAIGIFAIGSIGFIMSYVMGLVI
jgi:protein transport protein SEC61 subunit gamma and related proteins